MWIHQGGLYVVKVAADRDGSARMAMVRTSQERPHTTVTVACRMCSKGDFKWKSSSGCGKDF